MRIGVPREVKDHEYRVALTPSGVGALVADGHEVLIESEAGLGSSLADADYAAAGAQIVPAAGTIWGESDLVVKVKEPVASEFAHLRPDLTLFTFLHLAADRPLTEALLAAGTVSLAYETVRDAAGRLPLLAPMSEVAGRLSTQVGFYHALRPYGGRGLLPGGVPGTAPAQVTVIGGGVAGVNAARVAAGLGAEVVIFDIDAARLRAVDEIFGPAVRTRYSHARDLRERVVQSDLVIGAVLVPGAKAPTLVDRELVERMRPGAVLVDISIDQGGCFADARPTTHGDPTYRVGETIFYCVSNMPGAVPATATPALENVTLGYTRALARRGWREACRDDPSLAAGLHTAGGALAQPGVAEAHALTATPAEELVS